MTRPESTFQQMPLQARDSFDDELPPDGYVHKVSRALREGSRTVAKQAVIAGYERGSLTEDQVAVFLHEFGLGAA